MLHFHHRAYSFVLLMEVLFQAQTGQAWQWRSGSQFMAKRKVERKSHSTSGHRLTPHFGGDVVRQPTWRDSPPPSPRGGDEIPSESLGLQTEFVHVQRRVPDDMIPQRPAKRPPAERRAKPLNAPNIPSLITTTIVPGVFDWVETNILHEKVLQHASLLLQTEYFVRVKLEALLSMQAQHKIRTSPLFQTACHSALKFLHKNRGGLHAVLFNDALIKGAEALATDSTIGAANDFGDLEAMAEDLGGNEGDLDALWELVGGTDGELESKKQSFVQLRAAQDHLKGHHAFSSHPIDHPTFLNVIGERHDIATQAKDFFHKALENIGTLGEYLLEVRIALLTIKLLRRFAQVLIARIRERRALGKGALLQNSQQSLMEFVNENTEDLESMFDLAASVSMLFVPATGTVLGPICVLKFVVKSIVLPLSQMTWADFKKNVSRVSCWFSRRYQGLSSAKGTVTREEQEKHILEELSSLEDLSLLPDPFKEVDGNCVVGPL